MLRVDGKGVRHQPEFWLSGQLALDLYRAINDKEEIEEVERIEPISR
jgi:hypothetical protein